MEFLWDTMMIDTRTAMKSKYEKDKYVLLGLHGPLGGNKS